MLARYRPSPSRLRGHLQQTSDWVLQRQILARCTILLRQLRSLDYKSVV
jgi:hypothetical protein